MISSKNTLTIASFILLILISAFSAQAAGEVDTTFNGSAYGNTNANVYVIKTQPDGKILIGGIFTETNGFATSAIARLNADGSVDTSFYPPDFFNGYGIGVAVYAIAVQPDGKILVGGTFAGVDGVVAPGVRRLNADGSTDSSWTIQPIGVGDTILDIEVLADGKILIGGFLFMAGDARALARLNSNGTYDNTFGNVPSLNPVYEIEMQPDGKILVGSAGNGAGSLARLNPNGSADATFTQVNTNDKVQTVKLQSDGKILIGGDFSTVNSFTQGRLSRVNPDGSLDLNFNLNNPGANGFINDIAIKPDGKILIGGSFSNYNTTTRQKLAQLNTDGTLDASFSNNSVFSIQTVVNDIEIQTDGKILVGTNVNQIIITPSLIRFNADATVDATFTPFVTRMGGVQEIVQQADGKILIVGNFPVVNGVKRNSLARLNANGTLDTSFVPYFNNAGPYNISAVAVQADGKVLIGGIAPAIGVFIKRLNADGSEDTSLVSTLSSSNNLRDIVALPDGKIFIGGNFGFGSSLRYIVKLNSNGTVDSTSFTAPQPNNTVNKILVQPDGKVLIGGEFTQVGAFIRGRVARYNSDGALDASFNPPGGANNVVLDMDLQPDGKVVLGGNFTAVNGSNAQARIGRLNADGTLDASFAQTSDGIVYAVKVQPDGKILFGGYFITTVGGTLRSRLARLNSNGTVDATFAPSANSTVNDINLQADNKILLAGEFTKINGISEVRIARLLNSIAPPKTPFDYDGDGRADVSVFRPSTNRWYVFRSGDSVVSETTFGISGDIVAPADYDGDGKTDLAIFRPSSGDWWYLSSINGAQNFTHWGASGDIPRPSDFDGDGRADFVLFRPSNSTWYRISSANGAASNKEFGLAGDKPVTGDFDGDGKSDVAIYRPSTGDWWWQSSLDNVQRATHWGISTDLPAPADYDGDGKTDFAVYRPSNGTWYIYNSATLSSTILNFGIAEDKPVPADYDGDGKADIAVFRPSTGTWYQQKTTAGFAAQQFGVATDVPTENAFVP